jgi:hypothetical protein
VRNATCRRILVGSSKRLARLPVLPHIRRPNAVHLIQISWQTIIKKSSKPNVAVALSDGFPVHSCHLVDWLGTSRSGGWRSCARRLDCSPVIESVVLIHKRALHDMYIYIYIYIYIYTHTHIITHTYIMYVYTPRYTRIQASPVRLQNHVRKSAGAVRKHKHETFCNAGGECLLRVAHAHQERLQQPD